MATRKPCSFSCDSLPPSMDFIDLTVESPVHRPSQTSSRSIIRSQRHLDSKPESFASHKNVSDILDATVKLTTRVVPTTCWSSSGETRRVIKSHAKVRSTKVTASNKSKNGSKSQFKNKTKPDEIINLDDTVLPEPSSSSRANNSTTLICAICLEELLSQRKPTATHCGHIFCEECLNRVMSKVKLCPQCRSGITKKSCIRLHF